MTYEHKYDLTETQNLVLRYLEENGKADMDDICNELQVFSERDDVDSMDWEECWECFEEMERLGYISRCYSTVYEAVEAGLNALKEEKA